MNDVDDASAEVEHQHHHYAGSRIPWYLRAIWLGFWVFAIFYTIRYLVPAIQVELFE